MICCVSACAAKSTNLFVALMGMHNMCLQGHGTLSESPSQLTILTKQAMPGQMDWLATWGLPLSSACLMLTHY